MTDGKRTRGPNKQTPWSRGATSAPTSFRCCGCRSMSAIRCSAGASRRCSRQDVRDPPRAPARCARCSAARIGRRTTSARAIRPRCARVWGSRGRPRARRVRAPRCRAAPAPLRDQGARDAPGRFGVERDRAPPVSRRRADARTGCPASAAGTTSRACPGAPARTRTSASGRRFRLHGTLAGHRAAYTRADGRFFQPRRMRPVASVGVVGATTVRSRSCSPACRSARWCCRSGCRRRRRTSRSSITTSRIRAAGTRSTSCGGAIRTPTAAGATRRTCSC